MTEKRGRRFAWLLNRRLGIALLWTALAIGIAVAANLVGIRMLGGIEAWSQWLRAHRLFFGLAVGSVWSDRLGLAVDAPASSAA